MLEITILKNRHMGNEEATKVTPYMQTCDVFCREDACCTEQVARENETTWDRILTKNWSRQRMLKEVCSTFKPYNKKIAELMFVYKKPLHTLERFSERRSNELLEPFANPSCWNACKSAYKEGNIDLAIKIFLEQEARERTSIHERDIEIGRNLNIAEEQIRAKYSKLRGKKKITYVIAIGAVHSPEEYTSLETNIILLSDAHTNTKALWQAMDSEVSKEALHKLAREELDGLFGEEK